jgi:hypothetical protein
MWPRRSAANDEWSTEASGPASLGRSVWIEAVDRDTIDLGTLQQLVDRDGVSGALCGRTRSLTRIVSGMPRESPGHVSVRDVQDAADIFQTRHLMSAGREGFVSVELSTDTLGSPKRITEEARRLRTAISRRNVLLGVPALRSNLGAIRDLVAVGVSVNATVLYSMQHYRDAFDAYCAGLELRLACGQQVSDLHFVATFDLGALDQRVDRLLRHLAAGRGDDSQARFAGKGGITHALLVQRRAMFLSSSTRFSALTRRGAHRPRLLWLLNRGDPLARSPVRYLDALGRGAGWCAMPLPAVEGCRRAGVLDWRRQPVPLEDDFASAMQVAEDLRTRGVDLDTVAQQMQEQAMPRYSEDAGDRA